jgi:hypothetical protein
MWIWKQSAAIFFCGKQSDTFSFTQFFMVCENAPFLFYSKEATAIRHNSINIINADLLRFNAVTFHGDKLL